ncbi:unnamed protein product [Trichobilharzia szidati]|nr:unnamed protein product [Trichobilharzia szidati]
MSSHQNPIIYTFAHRSPYIINRISCMTIFTIIFAVIADMSAVLLLAIPKIRHLFPLNIIILFVYTISASFVAGFPFACMNILWALASWGTTLVVFFSTVVGGAYIRVKLLDYWLTLLSVVVSEFIATLIATIVLSAIGHLEIAMIIFGGGMAVLIIILAIISGQITLSQHGIRTTSPDYCLASIILHAVSLLLFIISALEFYFTLPNTPKKCNLLSKMF